MRLRHSACHCRGERMSRSVCVVLLLTEWS
jgi:hypothetical protein